MTIGRRLRYGETGILIELDDLTGVLELNRALAGDRPAGVIDVVPAARTVLVTFDPVSTTAAEISRWLDVRSDAPGRANTATAEVLIPVAYDGEDLDEVAESCGLTVQAVVRLHTGATYTVAFCGFAPGFAYLTGLPAELRVSRRPTPRTSVPAGSVALADEFTGVYPRASPGGWQLIGHTERVVFDLDREPPALLIPGTTVRFSVQEGPR